MANNKRKTKPDYIPPRVIKRNREITSNINDMISQMEISLYGISKKSDIDDLSSKFNSIMQTEMDDILKNSSSDINSFMTKLYSSDLASKRNGIGTIEDIFGSDNSVVISYLSELYKNTMLKFADIHEVSTQLVELREAIRIFRDTLISPDLTDGKISKNIKFPYMKDSDSDRLNGIITRMEKKFDLDKKIKNFITTNTLEYGEYYVYVIPYQKVFSDFMMKKQANPSKYSRVSSGGYIESATIYLNESVGSDIEFFQSLYTGYNQTNGKPEKTDEAFIEFSTDIENIMSHIKVCTDPTVTIPMLRYGEKSVEEFYESVIAVTETPENKFLNVQKMDSGIYNSDSEKMRKNIEKQFEDISDCYIKLIPPTKMRPIKLVNKVLGYFYIEVTDANSLDGVISSTMYTSRYDRNNKQKTIVDGLVERIVKSFNRDFLNDNIEFKEVIAEAITYYDLNTKSIRFQFIPEEYVVPFKVNEDEEGNGVSIIQDSLFYAKLYLLLLLFKIISILLYSNDTKVNYIKTSGIDKNVANKIQEIIREKQNKQINLMDLMSYSSVIQKVGRGLEQYIPTGRSNERGIETEILQGQDVQLNTELMEMLKTSYILGTGVPSAIMNYLNEADFAKSIETANTRFQGRVISAQLDFNDSITQLYKKLCKYSTNMTDDEIFQMEYVLTPPKFANNNTKQDALNAFDAIKNFFLNLYIGDQKLNDPAYEPIVKEFTRLLARENLPSLNFDAADKLYEKAQLKAKERELNPENKNTDNIDNLTDFSGM